MMAFETEDVHSILGLLAVVVVGLSFGTLDNVLLAFVVAGFGIAALGAVSERMLRSDIDDRALKQARRDYVQGETSLAEFEEQAELALDGRAVETRAVLEDVDGIGPEISASVSLHFDTIEDVETASRDELLRVYGVGEHRADKIIEEV